MPKSVKARNQDPSLVKARYKQILAEASSTSGGGTYHGQQRRHHFTAPVPATCLHCRKIALDLKLCKGCSVAHFCDRFVTLTSESGIAFRLP